MSTVDYLMESETEIERLWTKSNYETTEKQLLDSGIKNLGLDNPICVDAGTGVGYVAHVMKNLLDQSYESAELILLDASETRLEEAKKKLEPFQKTHVNFEPCNLEAISIETNSVDYIFCRFVFEYLAQPEKVFNELLRILKPNGKLVIADLDYNVMSHYPLPESLEKGLNQILQVLQTNKLFDPYMGRKLYSYFYNNRLSDIKVRMEAHHLFYGKLKESDRFNWEAKINQIIQLQKGQQLKIDLDLNHFKEEFMNFLAREDRFTYTPLILVEGIKRL